MKYGIELTFNEALQEKKIKIKRSMIDHNKNDNSISNSTI